MVQIDLNTKVLPTSHRVYMVRPGGGYHLRQAFFEHHAIAPDLAGLTIPNGVRPRDFDGIADQIKRARAYAEWVKTEETRSAEIPPAAIAAYSADEKPRSRPKRATSWWQWQVVTHRGSPHTQMLT